MVSVLQPDVPNRPGVPHPNSLRRAQPGQMSQAASPTSRQQNNPTCNTSRDSAQEGSASFRSQLNHSELTTMYFRSFLIFCVLSETPLLALQETAGVSRN